MALSPNASPHTRAVLRALLLLAAHPAPSYGYDLSRRAELKSGTLYPILQVGLASGWAALASAPGTEELLGVGLPPGWELRALAFAGVSLLLLAPAASRKMTP